jgi:hypothetical protein
MLHVVTIRSRTHATAADSNGNRSLVTDHMLASHAPVEVSATSGGAASHGSTSKWYNHRFAAVGPWYRLSVLFRRTLSYGFTRWD